MNGNRVKTAVSAWMSRIFLMIAALGITSGCATRIDDDSVVMVEQSFRGDPNKEKSIFVFLDGTRNDAASRTNVRRAFELVLSAQDPQTTSIYIEGVGTATTLAAMSGLGMEKRILRGYDFIAQSFRPGDRIYIVGFSRGAHQARALAGLISYAGLPPRSDLEQGSRLKIGNAIIEVVKDIEDDKKMAEWRAWKEGSEPITGEIVRSKLGIATVPAEVTFLGLWDTVPGSLFLHFGDCKEQANRKDGDRYKSNSYPPLRQIFHAVSLDEKRTKFQPILLCEAINPAYTSVNEKWFPGAHADVGGGYADAHGLADLSFSWLLSALSQSYSPIRAKEFPEGNPAALAHWSMGDSPGNLGSQCEDRKVPAGAMIDASAAARAAIGKVPVRVKGEQRLLPYPLSCASVDR